MPLLVTHPVESTLPPDPVVAEVSTGTSTHKHRPSSLDPSTCRLRPKPKFTFTPPSPTSSSYSISSSTSFRAPGKQTFHDPYGSPWRRFRLGIEVAFALSMLEGWEKGLVLGVFIFMASMLLVTGYGLAGRVWVVLS